jgi:hypothetical protein
MGKVHDHLTDAIREWIGRQHVCFVATAPSGRDGHVNVSPKGMDGTVQVLPDGRCAYLDLTGSGAETIAHLRDNGRITLMWCAFDGPPRIVRIHGHGSVVLRGEPGWDEMAARFPDVPGARAVIVVEPDRISDSCGYAVPLMDFREDRSRLEEWATSRSDEELDEYRAVKNATSIDGLPAIDP